MVAQHVRLEDVQWDSDGQTLVWLEGRADRNVLVARPLAESRRDLTAIHTPRGGVGYGGGEFTVAGGVVFFAERDGRLYRRSLSYDLPRPILQPFGGAAAPAVSPDGRWVVYVFSDQRTDLLALVDSQGLDWPVKLAEGADFYMQPVWSPDGARLAWIEWDHPNMPWDGARLKLGRLAGTPPRLVEQFVIAGDEHTPVSSPRFSPDGRWLSYLAANGEWQDVVLYALDSGERHTLVSGDGFDVSTPAWVQGQRSYGWSAGSQGIYYLHNAGGFAGLKYAGLDGRNTIIDCAPYTWLHQLAVCPTGEQLAMIASAAGLPERVVRWDGQQLHVEAYSESESLPPDALPAPQPLSWKTAQGVRVHGIYYPPAGEPAAAPPPAIVYVHGGPTSQRSATYLGEMAYFNTRGYAWLDVNYRGSHGYGRTYQDALRQHWGLADVEDVVSGAEALVSGGLADGNRLVIRGGSAGGYTVLNALIRHPGRFKAGVCLYGVSNLFTIALETHKFEEHYNDSLVGPLPQAAQRYRDWSPAFHAQHIRDPLAIFQGNQDRVVPPGQSAEIARALEHNRVPHLYRVYEGEGHGFRRADTITDYLQQTERFLAQYVLYA